jgi:ferrochelatase
VRKVTLAPLYPQFADSTVTTVVELAKQTIAERKLPLQTRVLQPFYDHPNTSTRWSPAPGRTWSRVTITCC